MSQPRPTIDAMVEVELGRTLRVVEERIKEQLRRPSFLDDCMMRYRQGQMEYGHKYEWLTWPDVVFDGEGYQELLDAVIYPAMQRVKRQVVDERPL